MKITDTDMFESLEFLRDDSRIVSNARARRVIIEEGRKHLKARLINQSKSKSFVQKEQDAYSNAEYRKLLDSLHIAIADDEHYRMQTDFHKARIEVWRSQSANDRFVNQRI